MAGPENNKAERTIEIRSPEGLHMRPAMQFMECANSYDAQIKVFKDKQCADGKSIMEITMLAAVQGTKLRIVAEGDNAEQAVAALAAILDGGESKNAG